MNRIFVEFSSSQALAQLVQRLNSDHEQIEVAVIDQSRITVG